MKRILFSLLAVLLITFGTVTVATAHCHGGYGGYRGGYSGSYNGYYGGGIRFTPSVGLNFSYGQPYYGGYSYPVSPYGSGYYSPGYGYGGSSRYMYTPPYYGGYGRW